jgi:DeoR family suf operon transcriptional repressor
MRWWERQIGGKTRGRIISLLRRNTRTVEEIADDLEVTNNAARAHLQLLEREGIIVAAGTRTHEGAGKPAVEYGIAPTAHASLSAAYAPILAALLTTLREQIGTRALDKALRGTGKRLVSAAPDQSALDVRVRRAAAVLTSLGAEIDVERTPQGYRLCGHACPIAAAVSAEPHACLAVEELVTALVGVRAHESCDRSNGAKCRFDLAVRSA